MLTSNLRFHHLSCTTRVSGGIVLAVALAMPLWGSGVTSTTVAAERATSGAKPLPMTGYKLDLLKGVVQDLLERLA